MRNTLLSALAAVLLQAPLAAAQTIPSPFRHIEPTQALGGFAGWLVTDRGELGIGPHSGPILGARYDIRFSGPLGGEVTLGTVPTQRTVQRRASAPGDPLQLTAVGDVSSLLLVADAGIRFQITGARTWYGLAPYLAGSGGLVTDLLRSNDLDDQLEGNQRVDLGPAFALGVGAGTDWFLTERLAVRLEAKDYFWRMTQPEGLTPTRQDETEWTHNLALTLGVSLHF